MCLLMWNSATRKLSRHQQYFLIEVGFKIISIFIKSLLKENSLEWPGQSKYLLSLSFSLSLLSLSLSHIHTRTISLTFYSSPFLLSNAVSHQTYHIRNYCFSAWRCHQCSSREVIGGEDSSGLPLIKTEWRSLTRTQSNLLTPTNFTSRTIRHNCTRTRTNYPPSRVVELAPPDISWLRSMLNHDWCHRRV